jgi:hypothetical protein
MQIKKKIYLTISFDHELSLGGAKCYKKNLFEPAKKIQELANKIKVPFTHFTDILCAQRFKEWDYENFYIPYKKQLKETLSYGSDIQLHIHPHWIDSRMINGKLYPSKSFRLGDFKYQKSPNDISGIIREGTELLTEICQEEDSNFECIAYRAGGYNMSPNTEDILRGLYRNGIRIDSSVAKGFYFKSGISEVNHRKMPKQANWTIPLAGPLNKQGPNGLYEIPIATRPRTPINNIPFLLKRVLYQKHNFDSGGKDLHDETTPKLQKLKRCFPNSAWMLSFDNFTNKSSDLMKILDYHINQHKDDKIIIASVISHPKAMGPYNLNLMEEFVEKVRVKFSDQLEFTTYKKVYDKFIQ